MVLGVSLTEPIFDKQVALTITSSAAHIAGYASPFSTDDHRSGTDRLYLPCRLFGPEQPPTASVSIRPIAVVTDLFIRPELQMLNACARNCASTSGFSAGGTLVPLYRLLFHRRTEWPLSLC
jgi:hypothetical protein